MWRNQEARDFLQHMSAQQSFSPLPSCASFAAVMKSTVPNLRNMSLGHIPIVNEEKTIRALRRNVNSGFLGRKNRASEKVGTAYECLDQMYGVHVCGILRNLRVIFKYAYSG